ncbi:IS701 family transposase [Nocardiopsis deserti]|uniref:IS701 family transposase n=1 Tax=Nocardiopsis deserti TaxID=2605988 RepID=UPI0012388496
MDPTHYINPIRDSAGQAYREFISKAFRTLPRSDRKRWAPVYLRGLLEVPGRKTIRRIVEDSDELHSATTTQSMQQFINQSPWEWNGVRHALATYVHQHCRVRAWIADNTVVPKRGSHSVGVARRFVPSLGRTVNCQVGMGLYLATERHADPVPVDWHLLLPGSWLQNPERRARARIPGHAASAPCGRTSWAWSTRPPMTGGCREPPSWSTRTAHPMPAPSFRGSWPAGERSWSRSRRPMNRRCWRAGKLPPPRPTRFGPPPLAVRPRWSTSPVRAAERCGGREVRSVPDPPSCTRGSCIRSGSPMPVPATRRHRSVC